MHLDLKELPDTRILDGVKGFPGATLPSPFPIVFSFSLAYATGPTGSVEGLLLVFIRNTHILSFS